MPELNSSHKHRPKHACTGPTGSASQATKVLLRRSAGPMRLAWDVSTALNAARDTGLLCVHIQNTATFSWKSQHENGANVATASCVTIAQRLHRFLPGADACAVSTQPLAEVWLGWWGAKRGHACAYACARKRLSQVSIPVAQVQPAAC